MEVESFIAILEMHERTPLSLYALREMFSRPGLYGTAPDHLREAHEHAELLVREVRIEDRFGDLRPPTLSDPTAMMAHACHRSHR